MTKVQYPTFSIVTITLNNSEGLQNTFKSIEMQDFKDFEWIVIDGESTDDTLDFLRQHRSNTRTEQYPFQFISEKDDGIYHAMNKGIEHTKGKYILFLNAGDRLASKNVLKNIAPHTQKKPHFIYGDALEPKKKKDTYSYKTAKKLQNIHWGMFTHHQSMLYNRHLIRDSKMKYSLLYKIAADYDFTIRFLQKSQKTSYYRHPICIFEPHGTSQKLANIGRKEQYIIRERLNIISQPLNLWIYFVQFLSWHLKANCPWLYKVLKSLIH